MPTTTNYIWDDANYLAESDVTNTINVVYTNEPRQYGNLVSTRIGSTTSYHHFDALGSTRQLTNAAGHVTDKAIFDAWGNVANRTGSTPARLLWIGQVGYYSEVETGANYIRARVFAPLIARWMSSDPLLFSGPNLYVYGINTPTGASDPSGLLVATLVPLHLGELSCGDTAEAAFEISLEFPAPCDGYIIQQVQRHCKVDDCPPNCLPTSPLKPSLTYWELLKEVRDGIEGLVSTDKSTHDIADKTCGSKADRGTIRFFCKKDNDGKIGRDVSSWQKGKVYGRATPGCLITAGPTASVGGLGMAESVKPTWWDKFAVGAVVTRVHSTVWNCCPDCPKPSGTSTASVSPRYVDE
jgi:RHS repeat-associated protein